MTQDDILRMARIAGWSYMEAGMQSKILKRFANLVAAAERNKLATWMMEKGYTTGHGDTIEDMLEELDWQIREACAKVCGELADNPENSEQYRMGANWARERIRARGESK